MTVAQNVAFPLQTRKVAARRAAPARGPRPGDRAPVRAWPAACRASCPAASSSAWRSPAPPIYDPPVLLMDEPLGALDKNLREELQDEIRRFHRQVGATIVYVTHDQAEAAALADRVAILNHGRLEQIDTPRPPVRAAVQRLRRRLPGRGEPLRRDRRGGRGRRRAADHAGGRHAGCAASRRCPAAASCACGPNASRSLPPPARRPTASLARWIDAVFSTGSIRYRIAVGGCVDAGARRQRPRARRRSPSATRCMSAGSARTRWCCRSRLPQNTGNGRHPIT